MNLSPTFSLFVIPISLLHFSPRTYKPSNGNSEFATTRIKESLRINKETATGYNIPSENMVHQRESNFCRFSAHWAF